MLAAISEGTWAFLAVLVTNVVILVGIFYRQGKQSRSVEQINRAVNHQEPGASSLIDRVINVERRTEQIADETLRWRRWNIQALSAIASHIGLALPDRHGDAHE